MKRAMILMLTMTMSLLTWGCAETPDNSASSDNLDALYGSSQIAVVTPEGYNVYDEETGEIINDDAESEEYAEADESISEQSADLMGDGTPAFARSTDGVDVDLTALSSTMVYSQVYNMMVTPENFTGKVVKMQGSYSCFYDSTTGNYYYACIIQDATACCSQGIEFILTDDYKYPQDYPTDGDIITVQGVFDTYYEGENMYCTLRNAKLL